MKKFLTVALATAILCIGKNVKAQEGFSFSVKLTPQFTFLENRDDNNNPFIQRNATFHTNFGIGTGCNLIENFGVGMDLLYSLQGQRYEIDGVGVNQKINYIKIPVYWSINSDPAKDFSFIGKTGPQLGILTHSKLTDKDGNDFTTNTNFRYHDATFGWMMNAGVQSRLSRDMYASTAVRFDYDFTNADLDRSGYYPAGRANTHNMTFGLEIGLKYVMR